MRLTQQIFFELRCRRGNSPPTTPYTNIFTNKKLQHVHVHQRKSVYDDLPPVAIELHPEGVSLSYGVFLSG